MTTPAPTVTDHEEFERQLLELRKREKAHTREGEAIAAFRDFMGSTAPWYSNAHVHDPTVGHAGRIACYLRREDKIYLTYWTTGRGDEVMSPSFGLLDMTAYGRREEWEDSPEGWPQFPTHSVLRTDEHGAPMGPRSGGRPVPQWTRPGVTGVGDQTGEGRSAGSRGTRPR